MKNNSVKVGVGVHIIKDSKILLGKRINAHGENTWCPPGGHLEFGESIEDCAIRETEEEAGIKIKNIRILGITNDIFKEKNKHYLTVHVLAEYDNDEVRIMEPDKCEEWAWFEPNKFPENLFLPVKNLLEKNNNIYNF